MRAATVAALAALAGCGGGDQPIPADWRAAPIDSIARFDAPEDEPVLQLLCAYGQSSDNHAAVLLTAPGRPRLFWDPGGQYGHSSPLNVKRRACLIDPDAPALSRYMDWRTRELDYFVEVFEWRLRPERAQQLHDLLTEASHGRGPGGWTSNTLAGFCAHGICVFFQRFAPDIAPVDRKYRLPSSLSKWLKVNAPPDRMLAIDNEFGTVVYEPPRN